MTDNQEATQKDSLTAQGSEVQRIVEIGHPLIGASRAAAGIAMRQTSVPDIEITRKTGRPSLGLWTFDPR